MIRKKLEEYRINHLYYMAPMSNVPFILALGILSYNIAKELPHKDVSLWSVQKRREKLIPGTNKKIHDYVPLYFSTHTPMQYNITQGNKYSDPVINQKDLVFFEIDAVKIFELDGIVFTDGNAASKDTRFYYDISSLDELDWYIIRYVSDTYSKDYKRKKAAEVLVPNRVPTNFFNRVIVYNKEALCKLNTIVENIWEKLKKSEVNVDWDSMLNYKYEVDTTCYYPE